MSELDAIDRWLFTVLSGDATLMGMLGQDPDGLVAVYDTLPNPNGVPPLVVYQLQSPGNDVVTANWTRIMAAPTYVVKAACEGPTFEVARPIADRIDALLHRASGTNVDGTVLGCSRERPFKMLEDQDNRVFAWLGGFYRLWAQR